MRISLIVMLSLPVLYLTGSLRESIKTVRIGGGAFVLYFLMGAALTFIPAVTVLPGVSFDIAGAFLCVAPAVYLWVRRSCSYRLLLAALLSVLLAVSAYFIFSAFTLPFIPALTGAAIALLAIACLGRGAAPRVPVMAGVFGVCGSIMEVLTGQTRTLRLFDVSELAVLCFFFCFIFSSAAAHFGRVRPAKQKASGVAGLPGPEFPGTEFPEPEFPKPEVPEPGVTEPVFPKPEFPKPEPADLTPPQPAHTKG